MAQGFRRRGESFVAAMDEIERTVVAGLLRQTRDLLAPDVDPTGDPFEDLVASIGDLRAAPVDASQRDPALQRLLPDAHRGDESVAVEFRRLTEQDLRTRKSENLTSAIDALAAQSGDRLVLSREQAQAFTIALTDTRLLLGERLGLRTDEDVERLERHTREAAEDDPVRYAAALYDFLTWLQETLTLALLSRRRSR